MTNNVLVLTYWSYKDALIQTYTLPYVRILRKYLRTDSKIYLFTLEQPGAKLSKEQEELTKVSLKNERIIWLPYNYNSFGFRAFVQWAKLIPSLSLLCLTKQISHIHCWCTPAGAIGYVISVLTGKTLVLDSYEPHAEAMIENGTWHKNHLAYRILFTLEKWQSRKAQAFIAASSGMKSYARQKYALSIENFYVKPACVNLELFSYQNIKNPLLVEELKLKDKIVCVYAGKFGGIYLDKEVFQFLKVAHTRWGEKFRVLLLTSHSDKEIENFCKDSELDPGIIIRKFVPHHLVADYMGLGDFALTPVKPIATKRYCTPIKDGEYWALGLPVVISYGISDDSNIIAENEIGAVLDDFTLESYQNALDRIEYILKMHSREELYSKIRAIAQRFRSFQIAEEVYASLYRNKTT